MAGKRLAVWSRGGFSWPDGKPNTMNFASQTVEVVSIRPKECTIIDESGRIVTVPNDEIRIIR